MVRSSGLSAPDIELLRKIDSRVHPYEDMYTGDGRHYFSLSISAVRCIDAALQAADAAAPTAILDMPCGFGRVTRSLVARFPEATVTACDIRRLAVRFCARRFDAEGVISTPGFEDLSFARVFDLVWCGSLITHLDAPQTLALLDLFTRSSRPGALIVVTTHGAAVAEEINAGADYMLTPDGIASLSRSFQRTGYGYASYPWDQGYGVSVVSPQWVRSHATGRCGLHQVYFEERGWGSHHDVFGFIKQ